MEKIVEIFNIGNKFRRDIQQRYSQALNISAQNRLLFKPHFFAYGCQRLLLLLSQESDKK